MHPICNCDGRSEFVTRLGPRAWHYLTSARLIGTNGRGCLDMLRRHYPGHDYSIKWPETFVTGGTSFNVAARIHLRSLYSITTISGLAALNFESCARVICLKRVHLFSQWFYDKVSKFCRSKLCVDLRSIYFSRVKNVARDFRSRLILWVIREIWNSANM